MPAVLRDPATQTIHEIDGFCIIGRGESATLRLADASISRQHASIRREHGGWWLVDLGSANGTYVNETALGSARRLVHGDRIRFGHCLLLFEAPDAAPESGPDLETDLGADGRTQIARPPAEPLRPEPVTLLVADLKGFTELGNRLGAEAVAAMLRDWYAGCETVLRSAGASIDKFMGDGVFAYWHGTSQPVRLRALKAADELRRVASGGQVLDCRVGLHVGDAAIGALGRGINTAVGDAVNMAFRIEGLTRTANVPVLASAAFVAGWAGDGRAFASLGTFAVKGFAVPIEVFSPGPAPGA